MTGLVPVIHVVKPPEGFRSAGIGAAWMTGTSPVMAALVSHPSLLGPRCGAFDQIQIDHSINLIDNM
jgi:hypothetical protein